MLSAFFVLAAVVGALSWSGSRRHRQQVGRGLHARPDPTSVLSAAVILGIVLGGFADGIVLHQILQWHNMLSAKVPATTALGKGVNMFWDGVFHFFTLFVTLVGVVRLWAAGCKHAAAKNGSLLAGGLLMGWGLFNAVEGVIDHQILRLHNVREASPHPEAWNVGFLVFAVLLLVGGGGLARRGAQT